MKQYLTVLLSSLFLAPLVPGFSLKAQNNKFEDCITQLEEARNAYSEGRIEEVWDYLKYCLKPYTKHLPSVKTALDLYPKAEREAACHLMVNAHVYMNEPDTALLWMTELLYTNPEYILKRDDTAEFLKLYKKMRIKPLWIVGLRLGGNLTGIRTFKSYSLDNGESPSFYNALLGFQIGAVISKPLTRTIDLTMEASLFSRSYRYEKSLLGFSTVNFSENHLSFEFPAYVRIYLGDKYNFEKTWHPYVYGGASLALLFRANADLSRSDRVSDEIQREVTGPSVNLLNLRQRLLFSGMAGVGLEYKRGRGSIVLDLRYQVGFSNIVNKRNRYAENELIFRYGHIDNDLIMNNYSISLAYMYPFYKPRPKRKTYLY